MFPFPVKTRRPSTATFYVHVPGPCGTALTTGTMNWMTSGRKRVQRSQKIKELRAKHFAKVAADRARALPHPSRSTSNTINGPRQSTDVSRLKSRWVQASQPGLQTMAATVQRPQSGSTSTDLAQDLSSPSSPLDAMGGGPEESSFQPGMLNLDVTPPLGTIPRVHRGDISSLGKTSALASDIAQEAGTFVGPFQQEQRQPASAPPLRPEAIPSCPPHLPYLGRRQLVFGGGCEDGQHSREDYEGQHSREDYEGQPLGSEAEPKGNPMRFFNSGVEIAHDGSPVSEIVATLSQPVGIAMAQLPLPSDPDSSVSGVGVVGAREPAGGRGLPRFSKGAMLGDGQSAVTPSRSWEGGSFEGTRNEGFLSSATDLEPGVPINFMGETYTREHDQTSCWSFEEEAQSAKGQGQICASVGQEDDLRKEPLTPPRDQTMPAKFEALARTWGLFRGALDSTPGKITDNNTAPSSNNMPSPAYHAELLGARKEEGHGGVRDGCDGGYGGDGGAGGDGGGIHTQKRVCDSVADEPGLLQAKYPHACDLEPLGPREEEDHAKVQDDRTIYTPKRGCESVVDGTDTLQANNPHAYDSPPRSHQPSGSRHEHDDDCSRSPELVMLWDVGGPPDEDQAQEATPAIQPQKLQGQRQLCGATSTSPSPVINLALESDISQDEQAPQESQLAANVLQRVAPPQISSVAAVEGEQGIDKDTSDHVGALSALELTQASVEGDDMETTDRVAGDGPTKKAQQPQAKAGTIALSLACAIDSPQETAGTLALSSACAPDPSHANMGKLALSPVCALDASEGGGEDKRQKEVGGNLFLSSERQVLAEGVDHAVPAKELVDDARPTVNASASSIIECRVSPVAVGSEVVGGHDSPKDKSTPESSVKSIGKSRQPHHMPSTSGEGIDKPCQPRHVSSMDESASQDETRKRARETVGGESEQKCDHAQEYRKEKSASVTGRNGKCRRRQISLAATSTRRKLDGGGCRVGTRRGRTMANTRGYDCLMEGKQGVKNYEISTVTWYRTIVACLTMESRE